MHAIEHDDDPAAGLDLESATASIGTTLRRVLLGGAVMFAVFATATRLVGRPIVSWLVSLDVAASLALLALAGWLKHRPPSLTRAHAIGYAFALFSAAHALVSTLLFDDPHDAFFCTFLVFGLGAVALAWWPTLVLMAGVAVGAVVTTLLVAGPDEATGSAVGMMTSFILGVAVLLGRREAMQQAGRLRRAERQRTAELAATTRRLEEELAERRRAEARQADLEAQLRQVQKLDALGTLAGGVAHDMNNVLAAVTGIAQVAAQEQPEASQARRDLADILAAARHGATLTRNLLGFARKGKLRHEVLVLEDAAREVLSILERTAPKRIRFVLEAEGRRSAVVGDAGLLGQAVMNLCLNAVEAIGGDGTIRLRTGRRSVRDGESATLAAGARYVTLEVIDDGAGMAAEALAHAFEPFWSGKPPGSGHSGLGLAMVYGTVREHHGEVALQSVPGRGTTARITLPESEAAPAPAPAAKAPAVAPEPRTEGEALVVDDDPAVRAAIRRLLASAGLTCRLAEDGEAGLVAFRERPGQYRLVVLDLAMPGLSGTECFGRLRAIDPAVPILLVSGYPKDQSIQALLDQGRAEFLGKPFDVDAFLAAAARLRRTLATPAVAG